MAFAASTKIPRPFAFRIVAGIDHFEGVGIVQIGVIHAELLRYPCNQTALRSTPLLI